MQVETETERDKWNHMEEKQVYGMKSTQNIRQWIEEYGPDSGTGF